jgi:hypothetical protein
LAEQLFYTQGVRSSNHLFLRIILVIKDDKCYDYIDLNNIPKKDTDYYDIYKQKEGSSSYK